MTDSKLAPSAAARDQIARIAAMAALAGLAACTSPEPVSAPASKGVAPEAAYSVRVDRANPRRLLAHLDVSGEHSGERTAYARGVNFGLAVQVSAPDCDGRPLSASGTGQWLVPADCRRLSWVIDVEEAVPNGVDASRQQSLYFADAGWWLLSEPTSLLRLSGQDGADVPGLRVEGLDPGQEMVGAAKIEGGAWRIPAESSAPEFFAFGTLQLQRHRVGPMHTTYVIDDARRFARLPLHALHQRALEYLAEVYRVPGSLPEEDRHLLVVWLGIDEALGQAGGAAGSRSFLANYVDGDEQNQGLNAARTMLILAHEQTHQLADLMAHGGPPGPTWLGESVAQYYGLKALARSGLDDAVVAIPTKVFIDPQREIEAGLVELNRRHLAGDPDAYDQFYFQGATFWAEVDRVLGNVSPDLGGLDALIPDLLQSDASGAGLPASFRALLLEQGGADMNDVLERFVGD